MVPIDICFMVCMSDALVRAEYLQQISKPLRFWFTTKRALSTDLICDIKSNKRWNSRHGYKQPIDLQLFVCGALLNSEALQLDSLLG